jgi:glycosyltransferase involved in cell wall biosynthesis
MKILALIKYGNLAASTRQRLLQYKPFFNDANLELDCAPLFGDDYLKKLFAGGDIDKLRIAAMYYNRIKLLIFKRNFDVIWVHDEIFPYLFGFMERLVFLRGRPVIYDFDDAIFHQYDDHKNALVRFFLGKKLQGLLRGSALAVCGNKYLQNYAMRFCKNTIVIPTVLDTDHFRPANSRVTHKLVTIGWIGSPSTWDYVKPLVPLLSRLAAELNFKVRVIGAGPNAQALPHFELVNWSEETEVGEIQNMDIGIMPLPDEKWARGKCGYKLIQYMACGVAVIASPVGVNTDILESNVSGILASSEIEWEQALRKLIAKPKLRATMGKSGRQKIVDQYSLQSQSSRLVEAVKAAISTQNH